MDMNYRGGMWEGGDGQDGVECVGGKWDNCNSIIDKYIQNLKKKKKRSRSSHRTGSHSQKVIRKKLQSIPKTIHIK